MFTTLTNSASTFTHPMVAHTHFLTTSWTTHRTWRIMISIALRTLSRPTHGTGRVCSWTHPSTSSRPRWILPICSFTTPGTWGVVIKISMRTDARATLRTRRILHVGARTTLQT